MKIMALFEKLSLILFYVYFCVILHSNNHPCLSLNYWFLVDVLGLI